MRLVVVGAGMAGLAAADAARHAGAEVVVLEARNRIGGRTWTVPLGPGSVDLGGAWVHDPVGNPVAEALAAAGIGARNDGPYFSRMALWSGEWLGTAEATALAASVGADWDPVQAVAALPDSDRFVEGVEWYLADRELNGRVAALVRFGLLWIMGPLVAAGPPDRISLAGVAAYAEGGGGNLVLKGGYRTLAERLSAGLDIRLEMPVTGIDHGGAEVLIHAGGETLECDGVVVTVPLGVLKAGSLSFNPPLSSEHTGALERLAMGTLEKIAFRFTERFWPESVWQITHVAGDRSFPVWFDFSRHVGAPTLVALYNPAVTPGLAELPPKQRTDPALEVLQRMFGSVPEPAEALTTGWTEDPWALGSYSYVPIGARVDDMRSLAEPVSDRLLLAGEATAPTSYGTVHAAFASGLRAAARALGQRPERLSLGAIPRAWLDH
jgi:polyamine oxidase